MNRYVLGTGAILLVIAVHFAGAIPIGEAAESTTGFQTPPPGGITSGTAPVADPDMLIDALLFEADSISIFDIDSQQFHVFIPGAPELVNASSKQLFAEAGIVWIRRSISPEGSSPPESQGLDPESPTAGENLVPADVLAGPADDIGTPGVMRPPGPGELTYGISGTTSPSALVAAQRFDVATIIVQDISAQDFLVYVPGAPEVVNTLTPANLSPDSVVWIRRAETDRVDPLPESAPVATGSPVAPLPVLAGPAPGTTSSPPPAEASSPAPAPAGPPQPARAPSTGGLLRSTSYERGEVRIESAHTSTSYGLGTTTDAARSGARAGYALLRPGDLKSQGGFRAEWHGADTVGRGIERWQGISFYVPSDWHQGDNPRTFNQRIIFQWHAAGSYGATGQTSPIYGLHLAGDSGAPRFQFFRKDAYTDADGVLRGRTVTLWDAPVTIGRWTDFAFNTIWSTGSSGKLVLYVNGKVAYSVSGATLAGNTSVYSKWGVYGQPTRILFDEVRIAEGPGQLRAVSP